MEDRLSLHHLFQMQAQMDLNYRVGVSHHQN